MSFGNCTLDERQGLIADFEAWNHKPFEVLRNIFNPVADDAPDWIANVFLIVIKCSIDGQRLNSPTL